MTEITDILASEVADSRGKPALKVEVRAGSASGEFSVPSGASTGSHEALELRDPDGHVASAIRNVTETILPALRGMNTSDQAAIDAKLRELDGTQNATHLGGNALIGVSIAAAKAAAAAKNVPTFIHLRSLADILPSRRVPLLYSNYINGGKHADSPLAFQEHIFVPESNSVSDAIEMLSVASAALQELIQDAYGEAAAHGAGDEGGYVIPESDPRAPFELLRDAIETAGYKGNMRIATDVAATSFYREGRYEIGGTLLDSEELGDLLKKIAEDFDMLSIEDPFREDAFADFARLQKQTKAKIVGDDLTVTNERLLRKAADEHSIRAIIIKPNQIGTLTDVFATMKLARQRGIDCIVSHRSGETMDDFIADLAFAFGAFGLKAGALRKRERRVKYERLDTISAS